MPFPFDKYPWLNFQELNLAYFIKHFREIFEQWNTLLNEMYAWKDATDEELAEWKSTVETGISSWETGLQQSMEDWKDETEADISAWEAATLAALDAWKTATTAVFEQIRTEAAASAQAAAGSASSAQTALAGAQAAQAAAEAAAAGIQSELAQIQTNTSNIAILGNRLTGVDNSIDDYGNILGESIIYPGIANGTPTNPGNARAVTTDFIPISLNDRASCIVAPALEPGQEYWFSYALYDGTKTFLSGQTNPSANFQTLTISNAAAAFLKWGIFRYDTTTSDYIALRVTDFSGGDIQADIVHTSGVIPNLTDLNNITEKHEEALNYSVPAAVCIHNKNAFIDLATNPGTVLTSSDPWGYKVINNVPYGSIFRLKTANGNAGRGRAYRWKYSDGTWAPVISASQGFDGQIICPEEGATLYVNSLTDTINPVLIYCGNAYTGIESNGRTSRFPAAKISIIGDSISTFDQQGFIIPGYAAYYPRYDVVNVFQTWWWKILSESGAKLEVNASYSGSYASDLHPTAPSFYARTGLIGSPDLIFVELGTNDAANSVPLGEYDYTTPYEDLSESTFRTAYIKGIEALHDNNPRALIVCLGARMRDPEYKTSIQSIVQHFKGPNYNYKIEYIDLGEYSFVDHVHPSYAGMREVASKILYPG